MSSEALGEVISASPMLALVSSTDPRWVDVALGDLDAVLVDHLHCELKAASNATAGSWTCAIRASRPLS